MQWTVFWILSAIEGLAAEWLLFKQPSEQRNAMLFGLSRGKLLLCAAVLALIILCSCLAAFSHKKDTGRAVGITIPILAYFVILSILLLDPPVGQTAFQRSLLERLFPLILWAAAFCIGGFLVFLFRRAKEISFQSGVLWGAGFICLAVLLIGTALKTGIGLNCISGTFYRQGVPLLEGHLVLPLLVLYPFILLTILLEKKIAFKTPLPEILICAAVWAAAFLTWKETPFEGRSYFLPALRLPNNNFYPSSDAENYDLLAQSILIGNGFRCGMTAVRPLYAAFLALLHTVAGNDYMFVTDLQIAVLALLPLCIYRIGRQIHRPGAGLLAAAWVILREVYSIRVTDLVMVSNSRLLMSDLPSALCIAVILLCGIRWYRGEKRNLWAFYCGAALGVGMLIRTQLFVLIAVLWMLFFCEKNKRRILSECLLSLAGICLVFAPWIIYNTIRPNESLSGDTSESSYLVKLYYQAAYGEPAAALPEESLPQMIGSHPREIGTAVLSHFFNNEISSLLILPEREVPVSDSEQFTYDPTMFWYRESARGVLSKNPILTLLYILLIGTGVAAAVNRMGFCGVWPLLVHLCYNVGCALALNSGFRFILPSDWILLIYFAAGCCTLMRFLICLPANGSLTLPACERPEVMAANKKEWGFALTFVVMLGLILPFCDAAIPYRFSENEKETGNEVTLMGRAIYPRFYPAGEGDSGGSSSVKQESDRDRMVWMFLDHHVEVLSMDCTPEEALIAIPDPLDVTVIGTRYDDHIEVEQMWTQDGVIIK